MLIFIDESGIQKGSGHSVVSFVYLCLSNAKEVEDAILSIEEKIGIRHFHWSDFGSDKGWKIRETFLIAASKLNFTFKISLVKNPINYSRAFENIFKHLIVESRVNKIVIDGKKPRWYGHKLKKVLRDKNISVKKIRTMNDESSPGLRLADALAGLFRSHADNPTEKTNGLIALFENKKTALLLGGQNIR